MVETACSSKERNKRTRVMLQLLNRVRMLNKKAKRFNKKKKMFKKSSFRKRMSRNLPKRREERRSEWVFANLTT